MMKNKILLFVYVFTLLCVSFTSSSKIPQNLYSVQTKNEGQNELLVIDSFEYKVLYNFTLDYLQYDIDQILSLDSNTGELFLLCSNANDQILVSINIDSPKLNILSRVAIENSFNYAIQNYVWYPESKTATIPAQVSVNGVYSNYIMATEFGNQNIEFYNLTHLLIAPYTIQGYDSINHITYLAYMNYNGSFDLMTFDFTNPKESAKYYYDISNILMINMIFTDPSGNLYFLNQQYKNATEPTGYFDICKVTLSEQPSCGSPLYTIYLGSEEAYSYIPYIQSQDLSTLLFIVNQAPGVSNFTDTILLSYVTLNGDSVSVTNVTIPNDDPSGDIFASKVYAF